MVLILNKRLILGLIMICMATICFSLGLYALTTGVNFFSALFGLSNESEARVYLNLHFNFYLGTLYLTIFGMIICVVDTIVYFTDLWQKDKLLWFHILYFGGFFITGMVAILGGSDYKAHMAGLPGTSCCSSSCAFQCALSPLYSGYRGQLTIFFACFSVFFVLYSLMHYLGIVYVSDVDEESQGIQLQNQSKITEDNNLSKNISFISNVNIIEDD